MKAQRRIPHQQMKRLYELFLKATPIPSLSDIAIGPLESDDATAQTLYPIIFFLS